MANEHTNDQRSFIYLGLAGETGRGRTVESGLYRLADGSDEWETLRNGLPDAPAVRALTVHPLNPPRHRRASQAECSPRQDR